MILKNINLIAVEIIVYFLVEIIVYFCCGLFSLCSLVAQFWFYDRYLAEDKNVNQLRDAIDLFRQVWRNKWLANALPILFLNKQDLLKQKIDESYTKNQREKLEHYFPEFANYARDERDNYLRAKNFIKDQLQTTVI